MYNFSFKGDILYRYNPFGGIDLFIPPKGFRGTQYYRTPEVNSCSDPWHWIVAGVYGNTP